MQLLPMLVSQLYSITTHRLHSYSYVHRKSRYTISCAVVLADLPVYKSLPNQRGREIDARNRRDFAVHNDF
jgi:hypothetical protein